MKINLTIDELLVDAERVSTSVEEQRTHARLRTVAVVREMERRLITALDGDTVRGLNNLAPGDGPPLKAARVHGKTPHFIDTFIPLDGREALILDKHGMLMLARRSFENGVATIDHAGREWSTRALRDDEIVAQDLADIARTFRIVTERHVAHSDKQAASYARTSALAGQLAEALGFAF